MKKLIVVLTALVTAFVGVTFTIYYMNLDMKLVHKLYHLLGKHYDSLEKDRKL